MDETIKEHYKGLNLNRYIAGYNAASAKVYGTDVHIGGDEWTTAVKEESIEASKLIIHKLYSELQPYEENIKRDYEAEFEKRDPFYLDESNPLYFVKAMMMICNWYHKEIEPIEDLLGLDSIKTTNRKIPNKLNTDEAKSILQKAMQAGLCDDCYKWYGNIQLLAYLADRMSHYLELTNKMDGNGEIQTSWKPFETLFEYDGKVKGKNKLKDAKQNWMRVNTQFKPTGYKKVDALFE